MSLGLWVLALANDLCEDPLRERPDGSEPGPCNACVDRARALMGA